MTKTVINNDIKKYNIHTIKILFTDMEGHLKCLDYTVQNIDAIYDNEVLIDGSSIKGFSRISESDMYLRADLSSWTFNKMPGSLFEGYGFLFGEIYLLDNKTPFYACPRGLLKKEIANLKSIKVEKCYLGFEPEFFILNKDENGKLTTIDTAGYFDPYSTDESQMVRESVVQELQGFGIFVEKHHHEVAEGQFEINIKYNDVLKHVEDYLLYKLIVKQVCKEYGHIATFMPKPFAGINGSGLHTNISLWSKTDNLFVSNNEKDGFLSKLAYEFAGGILENAQALNAFINPTVNSYKRLVKGYEAPVNIAFSKANRSTMIRIPAKPGKSSRLEIRATDASCNPYYAMAAIIGSGIMGVKKHIESKKYHITKNLFAMTDKERDALKIGSLSGSLEEAIDNLNKSKTFLNIFGSEFIEKYSKMKMKQVEEFKKEAGNTNDISQWELNKFLVY